jgi:probable phosphoglycerate mutase
MEEHHPPTWFALLRHARTAWNEEKRIQGQNDISLTPEGRFQAREWGRHLKQYRWDRIITSDARRALETAGLVNISLRLPLVTDGCLREQNWGRWTGKTVAQLKGEVPQLVAEQERAGWKFCPPGGEDRNTVWERSQRALQGARGKWPGERILAAADSFFPPSHRSYDHTISIGSCTTGRGSGWKGLMPRLFLKIIPFSVYC